MYLAMLFPLFADSDLFEVWLNVQLTSWQPQRAVCYTKFLNGVTTWHGFRMCPIASLDLSLKKVTKVTSCILYFWNPCSSHENAILIFPHFLLMFLPFISSEILWFLHPRTWISLWSSVAPSLPLQLSPSCRACLPLYPACICCVDAFLGST